MNKPNPNPYDDNAWLEASNKLQASLPVLLEQLWRAGSSIRDIEIELENALRETEFYEEVRPSVYIVIA